MEAALLQKDEKIGQIQSEFESKLRVLNDQVRQLTERLEQQSILVEQLKGKFEEVEKNPLSLKCRFQSESDPKGVIFALGESVSLSAPSDNDPRYPLSNIKKYDDKNQNNDEDENQVAPEYIIRIQGDSSDAETEAPAPEETIPEAPTPETTAPETTAPEAPTPETTVSEETAPETTAPQTPVGNKATATPNTVAISIADKTADMRAYSIDNTNYFSLRDIASLLNDTEKQFDIQYDKATKTVILTTQKPYALANTDYTNSNNMSQKEVTSTAITINVDGQNVALVSYNINNINYFSINDLAKALNINVAL